MRSKGTQLSVPEIARELKVDAREGLRLIEVLFDASTETEITLRIVVTVQGRTVGTILRIV
jgi:hypothetical protein